MVGGSITRGWLHLAATEGPPEFGIAFEFSGDSFQALLVTGRIWVQEDCQAEGLSFLLVFGQMPPIVPCLL